MKGSVVILGREARTAVVSRLSYPRRARTRCFKLPGMEDDYYSIDSILSENQVSVVLSVYTAHVCTPLRSHRKYNVPSRLTYPTWATSMGVASATYVPLHTRLSPFLTSHIRRSSSRQIKAQSKIQLPLWLAFILIYSCVEGATHARRRFHRSPLIVGITRILPSHLRSIRASGTRSMPRLRA